ncbi:MAG: hypothetical protein KJO21_11430 [Verrucomicrobiae bacterium]|nr:hypothetical protein [Verrucomicrobiae bacterium]NNJ42899.1 hypothetical protein [Akkermansiaceae bacterium]
MRAIPSIFLLVVSALGGSAGEKEIWYDATGKVVKVTEAQKPVERFVPAWQRREKARSSQGSRSRVPRSGSSFPVYDGSYGPIHAGYLRYVPGCHGGYSPPFRFRRGYLQAGWSVRLRF